MFFLCLTACSSKVVSIHQYKTASLAQSTQLQRTAQFTNLVGQGIITYRRTVKNKEQKDQCDFNFWKQGDSISLQVEKLDTLVAWFGGEGKNTWLFEMSKDETVLTIGGKHNMFDDIQVALTLLGLTPLPAGTLKLDGELVTLLDEEGRTWTATYHPYSYRPHEIVLSDGEHTLRAEHEDEIGVEVDNLSALGWPTTGSAVTIFDSRKNESIKIRFEYLSTIVEDEPFDYVMSLESLIKEYKPTKIVRGG